VREKNGTLLPGRAPATATEYGWKFKSPEVTGQIWTSEAEVSQDATPLAPLKLTSRYQGRSK
jgi:hypothetical protein